MGSQADLTSHDKPPDCSPKGKRANKLGGEKPGDFEEIKASYQEAKSPGTGESNRVSPCGRPMSLNEVKKFI